MSRLLTWEGRSFLSHVPVSCPSGLNLQSLNSPGSLKPAELLRLLEGRRSYPTDSTCSRFRLHAKQTRTHSPAAPATPLSENCLNPSTSLITPITGSTGHFRSR